MSDAGAVVRQFLHLLESGQSEAAVSLLDPRIAWRNTGLPTLRGDRVARTLLALERRGVGFAVTTHHAAVDGEIVLTERTDVLRFGRWSTSFWVCGTFRVIDGRIVLWDDHYSPGAFLLGSLRGLAAAVRPGRH